MFGIDSPGLSAPRPRARRSSIAALEPLEPRVLLAFTFFGQEAASGLDQPAALVVADFDGNGTADVAIANASGDNVSVLLGNGVGGFAATATRPAVGSAPRGIAAGDLDGDGLIDLVVVNSLSNTVTVLRNVGGGEFAAGVEVVVGSRPRAVVVADLNGDGLQDLGVTLFNSNQVAVLLNAGGDGGGVAFGAATLVGVGTGPVALVAADLDGDGDVDLATANITSGNVSVLRNGGSGSFTNVGAHAVGSVPRGIAAGDLDGDGAADLVVANSFSGTVSVLRNLGTGSFAAQAETVAGNQPHGVVLGDFDGDGDLDVATANLLSNDVAVLENDSAGVLGMPVSFGAGMGPIALGAADVDGDFDLDLLAINSLGNTLTLLWSGAAPENLPPVIGSLAASPSPAIAGEILTLTATGVSDPDGAVAEVRFYRDSNGNGLLDADDEALGPIDTDGADGWAWSGAASILWDGGVNRFFAQAFDNMGRAGNLAAAEVPLLHPPRVAFLLATPAPVQPGAALTLTATGVFDFDGAVQAVRFYRDSNGNGVLDEADQELSPADTIGGNGYAWTGTADPAWGPGLVRFFARATDDAGLEGAAAATVVMQSYAPTIGGATASPNPLIFGDAVTLTATGVADQDGAVVAVRFYADVDGDGVLTPGVDTLLGTDMDAAGGYTISAVYPEETGPTGMLRFFARAVDDLGVESEPLAFTTALRYRPEVQALAPSAFEVEPGARIDFVALASDFDGTVASVVFYHDSNGNGVLDDADEVIGADSSGGDGFTAFFDTDSEAPAGIERFFARATDNQGLLSDVAAMDVLVNRRPQLDGFFASPDPTQYFDTLVLSAYALDNDGDVETVLFYRDADGNGQVSQGDEFLGEGVPEIELGFVLSVVVSPFWGPGQSLFIAMARDELGSLSEPGYAGVTVRAVPVIDALAATPAMAPRGASVTLTAVGVRHDEGTVSLVSFYRDSNGDGELDDGDELLGTDGSEAGGWTLTFTVEQAWSRGATAFFAVASDPQQLMSPAAAAIVVVGEPPVIASLEGSPDGVSAGEELVLTASNVSSPDGSVKAVLFFRDTNGNGVLDGDESASPIVGASKGGGSWRGVVTVNAEWSGGPNRFFAFAVDDIGLVSGTLSTLVTVSGLPVIAGLVVSPGGPVVGLTTTLTATVDGGDGPAETVRFFRDVNGDGELDEGDAELSAAVESIGGGVFVWTGVVPESWGLGATTFFAVPVGPGGAEGEAAAAPAEVWTRVFFPEGWRNDTTINEYLPVVNPHPFAVGYRVIARYEIGERDEVIAEGEIPALSRGGLIIAERFRGQEALTRLNVGYALEVQSSAPLGAMLSRYDSFSAGLGGDDNAATGEALTSRTSQTWTFADVRRFPGSVFDFLLYYNPTETDGTVTFDLFYENGEGRTFTFGAAALRRGGVNFNNEPLPSGRFAVVMTSTVPLIAAHSRYEAETGQGFTALGEPSAGATSVVVPFVDIRPGVRNEVTLFNPSRTEPTQVTIGVYDDSNTSGAPDRVVNVLLEPGMPQSVSIEDVATAQVQRVTLRIESDLPIAVQASAGDDLRGDATATGATQAGTGWLFADAFLDANTAGTVGFEYLTLSNPGDTELTVTVLVYSSSGGEPGELTVKLSARQTRTIEVHADGSVPLGPGLNFFSIGAFAPEPFVAVFTHWDLFQNGGWSTFGTPVLASEPE